MALRLSARRLGLTWPSATRAITTTATPLKASEPAYAQEDEVESGFQSKIWEVLKMKTDPEKLWVSQNDTVANAITVMAKSNVGSLLVYDPARTKLRADSKTPVNCEGCVGIITERDYMTKVFLQGKQSAKTSVVEIMTPKEKLRVLDPNNTVLEAMHLMVTHNFRHVPVMDATATVGVLSMRDVMKALLDDQKHEIETLKDYIHGTY